MDKIYLKSVYMLSVYEYKEFEKLFLASFFLVLSLTMKHLDFGLLNK